MRMVSLDINLVSIHLWTTDPVRFSCLPLIWFCVSNARAEEVKFFSLNGRNLGVNSHVDILEAIDTSIGWRELTFYEQKPDSLGHSSCVRKERLD
jgi:hypothetical protein